MNDDDYYTVLGIIKAYNMGYSQFDRNLKNPYPKDSKEFMAYDEGVADANIEELKK